MSASAVVSPFIAGLRAEIDSYCRSLDARLPAYSYVPLTSDAQRHLVLQSRLYNEIRAAEVFGGWLRSTPEMEVKALLADAAHEELGHAALLRDRLAERGCDPFAYRPISGAPFADRSPDRLLRFNGEPHDHAGHGTARPLHQV